MKQISTPAICSDAKEKEHFQAEKSLISLNRKHQVIDEQVPGHRFNIRRMFDVLPSTVADLRTLRAAEILNLFNAVDNTVSRVGAARLFLSLMDPSFSLAQIQARQQSLPRIV